MILYLIMSVEIANQDVQLVQKKINVIHAKVALNINQMIHVKLLVDQVNLQVYSPLIHVQVVEILVVVHSLDQIANLVIILPKDGLLIRISAVLVLV